MRSWILPPAKPQGGITIELLDELFDKDSGGDGSETEDEDDEEGVSAKLWSQLATPDTLALPPSIPDVAMPPRAPQKWKRLMWAC